MNRSDAGFTLIELMIALFIISVLFTIAAYSYIKSNSAAKKTVCIANLKEIDIAIDQWVLENHIPAGTPVSGLAVEGFNNGYGYLRGGMPKCPARGEYIFGTVGIPPQVTCSKESEGHKLHQ